jgi:hypothetical protein
MKDQNTLCQELLDLGFKEYGNYSVPRMRSFFGKPLEGLPDCEQNGMPPSMHVNCYPNRDGNSPVEFEIYGEIQGRCLKALVYSVTSNEAIEFLPQAQKTGRALWGAFVSSFLEDPEKTSNT